MIISCLSGGQIHQKWTNKILMNTMSFDVLCPRPVSWRKITKTLLCPGRVLDMSWTCPDVLYFGSEYLLMRTQVVSSVFSPMSSPCPWFWVMSITGMPKWDDGDDQLYKNHQMIYLALANAWNSNNIGWTNDNQLPFRWTNTPKMN